MNRSIFLGVAVLAFAEVVFAQHEVVALCAQPAHGHRRRHGKLRRLDADGREHVAQLRAHGRLALDDEDIEIVRQQHRTGHRTHADGVP